ncbi:MAG: hypothetical protein IT460_08665 [Planctomycetes bacterium]|nr:hypothetical protein [Planctomycetota bacterium]
MRARDAGLVLLGASLGAAGALLATRAGRDERPDADAVARTAALERQVGDLERRLAERGPPALASAPAPLPRAAADPVASVAAASGPGRAGARDGATAGDPATGEAAREPGAVAPATVPGVAEALLGGAGVSFGGGTWVRAGGPAEPPPPPLDPSEVRRLLDSGDRADLLRALDDLARTHDRSHLPTLVDLVHRPERREDVPRLVDVIATTKDRRWSAVQATGAPDTPIDGDLGTAWASKQPDMGRVTLDLVYERAVRVDAVRVHETLAPGAVAEVLARGPDGTWTSLWQGTAPAAASPAWFEPAVRPTDFATDALRLVLDTDRVPGWNEIDAVELVGDGLRQWAATATASSSFSD